MHENKLSKSPKYAPINLPTTVLGISNAHDTLKIIIPTDFSHLHT